MSSKLMMNKLLTSKSTLIHLIISWNIDHGIFVKLNILIHRGKRYMPWFKTVNIYLLLWCRATWELSWFTLARRVFLKRIVWNLSIISTSIRCRCIAPKWIQSAKNTIRLPICRSQDLYCTVSLKDQEHRYESKRSNN